MFKVFTGVVFVLQLLQSVNTQAAKAQQAKMQANKKASKESTTANEEVGSTARPASPSTAQVTPSEYSMSCDGCCLCVFVCTVYTQQLLQK